jgi:hypothetical protein
VKTLYFLIATLGVISLILVSPGAAQGKQVVGWLEKVCIYPGNLVVIAKLDTGAKNSSLNASNITEFTHNGEQWVRFNVTSRYGKTVTIERKVHRMAKIKRHGGRVQPRYSIHLGICLGDFCREAEVNLVDRSGFNYQMLISRSFLAGNLIVDPSIKYTTKPICKVVPRQ